MSFVYQPRFFNETCRRYAYVIQMANVKKELDKFLKWAQKSFYLWSLIKDPALSKNFKNKIFECFYKTHPCNDKVKRTLSVLAHHKRLGILPDILCFLEETKNKNCKQVYLTTPKCLSKNFLSELSNELQQILNAKIIIKQKQNEDLISGCVMIWDHFMWDVSLYSSFCKLKNKMLYVVNNIT
jgi:F0F1-type ATP synthase delta subunit